MQRVLLGCCPTGLLPMRLLLEELPTEGGIDPRKDSRVRKETDEHDTRKGGEKTKPRQKQGEKLRNEKEKLNRNKKESIKNTRRDRR